MWNRKTYVLLTALTKRLVKFRVTSNLIKSIESVGDMNDSMMSEDIDDKIPLPVNTIIESSP
jgi:hypothetical protein